MVWVFLITWLALGAGGDLRAQAPAANKLTPNLVDNIQRPLRYHPDNGDFVIENGGEYFNRPLYGRNTAFRVDAGDVPEFLLYLPGRGGNLRLGLQIAASAKWLHETKSITARYRPGQMLYEIRDPLLGDKGVLRLSVLPMHETDGLIVRLDGDNLPQDLNVLFAFGGVSGKRGKRDGDIGTEAVPIAEYFQLTPDVCAGDHAEISAGSFTVRSKAATIIGLLPEQANCSLADASRWSDAQQLRASSGSASTTPVVVGSFSMGGSNAQFIALQRVAASASAEEDISTYREVTAAKPGANTKASATSPVLRAAYERRELPEVFSAAEKYYARIRNQIRIETPDPYLNAAVGALNIAADAVWDEPQQAIMHGAIAWRTKLLGWRGPYALDALGWTDRARRHFTDWAARQNTEAIPAQLPPAEEKSNLARNEAGLHSNGDISNSHYDMNLVYIDALFRHLRWTGDLKFAREMWPVIERHLAWERRLFRREFTTSSGEKLPLYEAYAAIWASDDLQYNGGGTAHASAYNYFHHREAAQLARLLKLDPAPLDREADLIKRGMHELLWQPEVGVFAEYKDLLGNQLVHPSAALWSVYHTIDSEVTTPEEASRMTDYVRTHLPRLPVGREGEGIYASTDWMPYSWSINNVVMGENVHTALAFWQARHPDEALALLRSSLLASMYMGICPGNVGSMNYLDVYRRESQRDFADGSGVTSRAIVEGLFGVRPNVLTGELVIAPGWPTEWKSIRLNHPHVGLDYRRDGTTEHFTITPRFARPMSLRLQLPMSGSEADVWANGQAVPTASSDGPLVVAVPPSETVIIKVVWRGGVQGGARPPGGLVGTGPTKSLPGGQVPPARQRGITAVDLTGGFNDRVTDIFRPDKYRSPRAPFVSLAIPAQGIGAWAGHVNSTAEIDDAGLRRVSAENGGQLTLPNGVSFATLGPGDLPNILFVSQWDNYPRDATIPLSGRAAKAHLLMAGSTNYMQSRLDNGEVIVTYVDGTTDRLALRNPETWWPIEQDYFTDDYQFRINGPLPTRVDLKTGKVRVLNAESFKGQGRVVPGGAATVLELPLDQAKELKSLTVRALANEVVIGLMAVSLEHQHTLP